MIKFHKIRRLAVACQLDPGSTRRQRVKAIKWLCRVVVNSGGLPLVDDFSMPS